MVPFNVVECGLYGIAATNLHVLIIGLTLSFVLKVIGSKYSPDFSENVMTELLL